MLERAARAAALIEDGTDEGWGNYLTTARAVLMAVRDRGDLPYAATVNWQNRIDDILNEKDTTND